ncbi:MAG: hypothetical protein FJ318_07745, partial [SAR202 cluster bacterium]|nr:hypothetical protein [SAR202 cluster bacterium]
MPEQNPNAMDRQPDELEQGYKSHKVSARVQVDDQRDLSAKRRTGLAFGPTYEQAALGLPNYWYPVMFSVTLGKRPRPFTLLGQHIVF